MLNIFIKRTTPNIMRATSLSLRNFAVHTRFTKDHEWIKYDDETMEGTYGITDHAQKELGDIVFVDFPFSGDTFEKGDVIGAVESVKTSAQIYTPVDIEILENNEEVDTAPELVNESPTGKGWITKIKITDSSALDKLMDSEAYEKFCDDSN